MLVYILSFTIEGLVLLLKEAMEGLCSLFFIEGLDLLLKAAAGLLHQKSHYLVTGSRVCFGGSVEVQCSYCLQFELVLGLYQTPQHWYGFSLGTDS